MTRALEASRAYVNLLPLMIRGSRIDPYPRYRRLRDLGPAPLSPFDIWVITRHADANQLLRSERLSSENRHPAFELLFRERLEEMRRTILFSDPPDHTRLRNLVSRAFTPRRIEALRGRVEEIADELITTALRRESFDLLTSFAYPLPMQLICEFLGVPIVDRPCSLAGCARSPTAPILPRRCCCRGR
jgi:cytochrome P450